MQCLSISFAFPSVNFRSRTNLPWGSFSLYSTVSLKDGMKEWYSNGSPLKVWISTSGADCYRNKLHNILLISPSKSLAIRRFLLGHLQHSWSCYMSSLRMIWCSWFHFQSIWCIYFSFIWLLTYLCLQHLLMNTCSYFCIWCSLVSLKFFISYHFIFDKCMILHS